MALSARQTKALRLKIRKLFQVSDARNGLIEVMAMIALTPAQLATYADGLIDDLNTERDRIIAQLDANKAIVESEKII